MTIEFKKETIIALVRKILQKNYINVIVNHHSKHLQDYNFEFDDNNLMINIDTEKTMYFVTHQDNLIYRYFISEIPLIQNEHCYSSMHIKVDNVIKIKIDQQFISHKHGRQIYNCEYRYSKLFKHIKSKFKCTVINYDIVYNIKIINNEHEQIFNINENEYYEIFYFYDDIIKNKNINEKMQQQQIIQQTILKLLDTYQIEKKII